MTRRIIKFPTHPVPHVPAPHEPHGWELVGIVNVAHDVRLYFKRIRK